MTEAIKDTLEEYVKKTKKADPNIELIDSTEKFWYAIVSKLSSAFTVGWIAYLYRDNVFGIIMFLLEVFM
ncbi:hypothetical protein GF369_02235 [Candidatus Peregrinibacteria bacterium]|nr:hypothetical protein [Candidatus Peregrinibacteria bacterium]